MSTLQPLGLLRGRRTEGKRHERAAQRIADAGSTVGGGAAVGAVLGYAPGSVKSLFLDDVEPLRWAERGAAFGGVAGVGALLERWFG